MRRRALGGALVALGGAGVLYRTTARRRVKGWADAVAVQRSLTIERPRDEVYARWREPETQALVWSHVAEIGGATPEGAHWRVAGPLGRVLEWDTRVEEEREGELLRWRSTGDLANEGTVEFRDAPGEYGSEVMLRVRFQPPAGALGAAAARFFDEPPKVAVAKTLRRFKALVESGEIPSTERNPSGRAA